MSLWPQHDAEGYYIGKSDDYGSGTQPNNTASMDDWPEIIPGFIPRKKADGPGWDQVEDHKDKEGYVDGQPFTVKDYGPLPDGWSDTPPEPTLDEAVAAKCAEIHAGYDAALAASLTMPASKTLPSAVEIALALDDFKAEDPEGWAFIRATHTARRDELLAQVEAAGSAAEVQGITVSYAV